jgi:hypothetical protein
MNLSTCVSCGRRVLELEGQFAKLDPYFVHDGAPPLDTAGHWHAHCLAASPVAPAWYAARLRNHCEVRGYQPIAELAHWTVVRHARTNAVVAFGRAGELVSVDHRPGRRVEGGIVYPVRESMYNLELEDAAVIGEIQRGLEADGTYPLTAVLDALGIGQLVVHPVALEGGVFRLAPALRPYWSRTAVSARAEYGVFVPAELEPYFTA